MRGMRLNRDALGIPILDGNDIEILGERFLQKTTPHVLDTPMETPLMAIAERIDSLGFCTFSFDHNLGQTAEGYEYLGWFEPIRNHIEIDRSLTDEPRIFAFTLAHELGHFYLHSRAKPEAFQQYGDAKIKDSTRDIVTHRIEASNPRTLLEWQANRFAAAILMPKRTVPPALESVQRDRGITRHLGSIWLDRQPSSQKEYRIIVGKLAYTYGVSKAVARFRLRELSLLHIDERTMPTKVTDTLETALADLFSRR
jgi:Zn-dependent peptidase ImmA (M78 family)